MNLVCKLGFHQFNKEFCKRCGINRDSFREPTSKVPKGKTQFIAPVSFKEKFNNSKNIGDILDE